MVLMPLNVLGTPLQPCCTAIKTGWFRDGFCRTDANDHGQHTVCAVMTADFLAFSRSRGNDLSTPRPEYRFPGLHPGDKWCVCALRWLEAAQAGFAPPVLLASCHSQTLEVIPLEVLREHAVAP